MNEPRLQALFAPDWRAGVPYQSLLGEALGGEGVEVRYLQHYRRMFPLARLMEREAPCDIFHLHWPEAYYPRKGDRWDWFRRARFPLDLRLSTRGRVLALTAHNLLPHNRGRESLVQHNARTAYRLARVVFAHSQPAKQLLLETHGLREERVTVVPHGDLSVVLGPPVPREEARAALRLPPGPLCLIFGAVEPYKGIEESISFWKKARPDCTLVIAGKQSSPAYRATLQAMVAGEPRIDLRLGWLDDPQLRLWLSATDCVLFNYRTIFTSGAANLTRSYGVPQLLPTRLATVVLDEPCPQVIRFADLEGDLPARLAQALATPADYAGAAEWRAKTAWSEVAARTAAAYRQALA